VGLVQRGLLLAASVFADSASFSGGTSPIYPWVFNAPRADGYTEFHMGGNLAASGILCQEWRSFFG